MESLVRKFVFTHGVRVPWKAWCGNLSTLMECHGKLGKVDTLMEYHEEAVKADVGTLVELRGICTLVELRGICTLMESHEVIGGWNDQHLLICGQ